MIKKKVMIYIFRWTLTECKVLDIAANTEESEQKVLQHGQNDETPKTGSHSLRHYYAKEYNVLTQEEREAVQEYFKEQNLLHHKENFMKSSVCFVTIQYLTANNVRV